MGEFAQTICTFTKCYTIYLRPICARFRHPEQTPNQIEIATEYCAHTIFGTDFGSRIVSGIVCICFDILKMLLKHNYIYNHYRWWLNSENKNTHEMCGIHFSVCTIVLRLCVFYSTLFSHFVFVRFILFQLIGFAYLNVLKCDLNRLIALCGVCLPADKKWSENTIVAGAR